MRAPSRAFTLVELLVVIGIIGVLSTLAMVAMGYARDAAKVAKAQHDIDVIVTALKQLENDSGQWPGHQTVDQVTTSGTNEYWDLNAAAVGIVATDGAYPNWRGPYMQEVRRDPWGKDYFYDSDYRVNGQDKVVIGSFGPNGVGQNLYDADDIIKILR
jgi:general secretion pathway protein G